MSSSSSPDDNYGIWTVNDVAASSIASQSFSGSLPGRGENREFGREEAERRLDMDFFWRQNHGPPVFSEQEYLRTYRMPRRMYEKIHNEVMKEKGFFFRKKDVNGKWNPL